MGRINDIAARAGVSRKTVSRMIHGHPNISDRMRKRIETAMAELGYAQSADSPDVIPTHGNPGIGVLFGDPDAGYQVSLYQALLNACQERSRYLVVEAFDETSAEWARQVEGFLDRSGVTRLILVPPLCDSYEIQALVKARGIRSALISPSRPVSGMQSLAMDDRHAAMEMTQHLLDLGHRRIGFVAGRSGHVATLLRRQGFEEAYAMRGLALPDESLTVTADFSFKTAMQQARKLLDRRDRPTAIFASNDEMAAAVILLAKSLGLSVPGDVSVAGFDDSQISQTVWPELTTIAQPYDVMARVALDQVLSTEGDNEASGITVIPHNLIVRDSTKPVLHADAAE